MHISLTFIRSFFILLSILFVTTYLTTFTPDSLNATNAIIGVVLGSLFGLLLIGTELLFKNFNLRSLNIAMIGLLCGYLLGEAILLVFKTAVDASTLALAPSTLALIRIAIFLFTTYLGMILTARAADELYVSIPFIRFKPTSHKKKDILLDQSALMDPRIIDLASSGLLDNQLILPRFMLKELNSSLETSDETLKAKARRCLDAIKKLENIPSLDLRFVDNDFPELKDPMAKLIRLARLQDANLMTADINRVQQAMIDGIRIINLHMLANALKPITQAGEFLHIKIQRYGKEPRQGVGYLEDGTMVVVNGGAEFIGETIKTQVLSVKHTSSGRMIFCNAMDESMELQETAHPAADAENSHKNYFAL
ncbi:MAG: hypothetical protein LLG04_00320 [Parachlamydia sp.]|nr:hypothetical protein [Parachlamydia sp.]